MSGSLYERRSRLLSGRGLGSQSTSQDRIEAMPAWRQLQAAGAPEEEVEKARLQESLYGPAGLANVSRAMGIEPNEEEAPGVLTQFFDYITRPGAWVTGMWTGLLGIDRVAQDGTVVESGSGLAEALDRGGKALSGTEKYRANEFGVLAYNNDDGGLEKAGKAVAGFVVDTVLDPLTYVSGPGSIFGRKGASSMIDRGIQIGMKKTTKQGDTILARFTNQQKKEIIERMSQEGAVNASSLEALLRRQSIDRTITDPRQRLRARMSVAKDPISAVNTPERRAQLMTWAERNGYLDDLFVDTVAAGAAGTYASKGFGVSRRLLVDVLGDSGDDLWKALPIDLQGGLRVRLPFLRKEINDEFGSFKVPFTWKVPGTGGGQLVEKIAPARWMRDMTNNARNFLRDMPGVRSILNNLNGLEGQAYRSAMLATFGEVTNNGAVVYRSYSNIVQANRERFMMDAQLRSEFGEVANAIVNIRKEGQKRFGDDFLSEDGTTGAVQEMMRQSDIIDDAFIDGLEDENQRLAARLVKTMLDEGQRVADFITDVIPDFQRLEQDYFPRMWETFTKMYQSRRRGGGLGNLGNSRDAFAAVFDTSGKIVRYRTPKEIFDLTGVEIFTIDPIESMLAYLMSVRTILNREFVAKELINRGVVVYPDVIREMNDLEGAVQAAVILGNKLQGRVSGVQRILDAETLEVLDDLQRTNPQQYRRVMQSLTEGDLELANILGPKAFSEARARAAEQMRREVPVRYEQRFIDWARENEPEIYERIKREGFISHRIGLTAQGLTENQTIRLMSALSRGGRRVMDRSIRMSRGRRIFYDGSYIQKVSGGWRVFNPEGRLLIAKEGGGFQWRTDRIGGRTAFFFQEEEEARRVLAQMMRNQRDNMYQELVMRTKEEAERYVAMTVKRIQDMGGYTQRGISNAFDVESIPPHMQNEYFAGLVSILRDHGSKLKFRSWVVSGKKYQEQIGDFMKPVGYDSSFDALPGIVTRMQQARLFAPEGLLDSINLMFDGMRQPGKMGKFINDYYLPFYALQKSLMTAQRGPGYAVRNIVGGMWNAYLTGVNGSHFRTAARIKLAEWSAMAEAKQLASKQTTDALEMQRIGTVYFEEIFSRNMRKEFGDKEGDRLVRAFASWTSQLQRGASPVSLTEGVTGFERLTRSPQVYGDMVIDPSRGIVKLKDMGKTQRVLIWGARENIWARSWIGVANESEDFLRLASFLRGAEVFGMGDGGFAASLFVKASQFDYSDLSEFEMTFIKRIFPFYTWTRNNIPLQFRALYAEPGKVSRAVRVNEGFAALWGEEEDPESPLPSYIRDRFGWTVRREVYETAMGDQITAGMVWGEPISDINRLFKSPRVDGIDGNIKRINWREIVNMTNPGLKSLAEIMTNIDSATGGLRPREEEAPTWAYFLGRTTPEGKRVVSSRLLNTIRDNLPPVSLLERLMPGTFGNDRYMRRQRTNQISTLTGLPIATLDAFQQAGELRARQRRLENQLSKAVGDSLAERAGFARELLEAGVTDAELDVIESQVLGGTLLEAPLDRFDPQRTAHLVKFMRNIQLLEAAGVPRSTLEDMWRNYEPPDEVDRPLRRGLTNEELAQAGITPEEIASMTRAEREALLRRFFEP